jgi:hypothetical protein
MYVQVGGAEIIHKMYFGLLGQLVNILRLNPKPNKGKELYPPSLVTASSLRRLPSPPTPILSLPVSPDPEDPDFHPPGGQACHLRFLA